MDRARKKKPKLRKKLPEIFWHSAVALSADRNIIPAREGPLFVERGPFRRKGARMNPPVLFNQILVGRFSLPLFWRILEQSNSITSRWLSYSSFFRKIIKIRRTTKKQYNASNRRRKIRPDNNLASTNNHLHVNVETPRRVSEHGDGWCGGI